MKKRELSRLRQKVGILDRERGILRNKLLHPRDMVKGSVFEMMKSCGNPGCRCMKGEKHGPFKCLSVPEEGKKRIVFIRKEDKFWVVQEAEKYKKYQQKMARLRKISQEIYEILKKIRDSKVKVYK